MNHPEDHPVEESTRNVFQETQQPEEDTLKKWKIILKAAIIISIILGCYIIGDCAFTVFSTLWPVWPIVSPLAAYIAVLVAISFFSPVVTAIGYWGVAKGNVKTIKMCIYFFCAFIFMAAVAGTYCLTPGGPQKVWNKNFPLKEAIKNYNVKLQPSNIMDIIQIFFGCCGDTSPREWRKFHPDYECYNTKNRVTKKAYINCPTPDTCCNLNTPNNSISDETVFCKKTFYLEAGVPHFTYSKEYSTVKIQGCENEIENCLWYYAKLLMVKFAILCVYQVAILTTMVYTLKKLKTKHGDETSYDVHLHSAAGGNMNANVPPITAEYM